MPLIGPAGWLAVLGVVTTYATLKLVKWSLNAEAPGIRQSYHTSEGYHTSPLSHVLGLAKLIAALIAAIVLWPGLASWATAAWHWLLQHA